MSLISRGFLSEGEGGFGARVLKHTIDLFVIRRPTASLSVDMIVAAALPSTQMTLTYGADLLVDAARTVRTDIDILVIDHRDFPGQWNDVAI